MNRFFQIVAILFFFASVFFMSSCKNKNSSKNANGFLFELTSDKNGIVITGIKDAKLASYEKIVIPTKINGKPVREIKSILPTEEYFDNLTAVELPDTIEIIGEGVFMGCRLLKTINLPSSLKEIGKDAFYYCYSLSPETKTALRNFGYTGNFFDEEETEIRQ